MNRLAAILVAAVLALAPAAALAASSAGGAAAGGGLGGIQQQAPSQPLQNTVPQEAPPAQQTPAPAPTTTDSGSISRGDLLLIAVAIAGLIGGIWFIIARDARRVTGGRVPRTAGESGDGRSGSATRAARRTRKLSAAEKQRRRRGRAR